MELNPYLNFPGTCEEAFRFYAHAFGGKVERMMAFDQMPGTPTGWEKKIMHARMTVGNDVLMGSDAPPDRYNKPRGFFVSVQVTTPADADRAFAALEDGGSVQMPIQKTFWAERFGMVVDRFGIPWMVNCEH